MSSIQPLLLLDPIRLGLNSRPPFRLPILLRMIIPHPGRPILRRRMMQHAISIDFRRRSHLEDIRSIVTVFGFCFQGPHDGTFEAHAETGGDALVEGFGEGLTEGGEVEGGEEAEGAEGEGGDGGDDALEQPGGVEDGAVAAQLEYRQYRDWGCEGGYGDDKVEEVGLSEAEFGGPEFDAVGVGWVLFY